MFYAQKLTSIRWDCPKVRYPLRNVWMTPASHPRNFRSSDVRWILCCTPPCVLCPSLNKNSRILIRNFLLFTNTVRDDENSAHQERVMFGVEQPIGIFEGRRSGLDSTALVTLLAWSPTPFRFVRTKRAFFLGLCPLWKTKKNVQ